jgi:MFS family permease
MNTENIEVYRMKKRDEMRGQLANIIGAIAFAVAFILIPVIIFRLYKPLALILDVWREPSWVDIAVMCLSLPLVAGLIGAATRWLLIYRWVAK